MRSEHSLPRMAYCLSSSTGSAEYSLPQSNRKNDVKSNEARPLTGHAGLDSRLRPAGAFDENVTGINDASKEFVDGTEDGVILCKGCYPRPIFCYQRPKRFACGYALNPAWVEEYRKCRGSLTTARCSCLPSRTVVLPRGSRFRPGSVDNRAGLHSLRRGDCEFLCLACHGAA